WREAAAEDPDPTAPPMAIVWDGRTHQFYEYHHPAMFVEQAVPPKRPEWWGQTAYKPTPPTDDWLGDTPISWPDT
ncbi:MAG: hypothetical protein ACRC7O_01510, partial [Fimbriiglobus sp.]